MAEVIVRKFEPSEIAAIFSVPADSFDDDIVSVVTGVKTPVQKKPIYDPSNFNPTHKYRPFYAESEDVAYALSIEAGKKRAIKNGLLIVEPDDKTLQLDFDTTEQWNRFIGDRLSRFLQFFAVDRVWWTESKSRNKHVFIALSDPQPIQRRIALQAALGSDPTREFLSLMSVDACLVSPVVMFEKPEATEVVIYATDGYQPTLTAGKPQHLLTQGNNDETL